MGRNSAQVELGDQIELHYVDGISIDEDVASEPVSRWELVTVVDVSDPLLMEVKHTNGTFSIRFRECLWR